MTFNGEESQEDMVLSILYVSYLFKKIREGMGPHKDAVFFLNKARAISFSCLSEWSLTSSPAPSIWPVTLRRTGRLRLSEAESTLDHVAT